MCESIRLWCVETETKPTVSASVITPPHPPTPPPLTHGGSALILWPRPELSEEHVREMINGGDLIPPAQARPFLNLANPIRRCNQATVPGRMQREWAWWGEGHPGHPQISVSYISLTTWVSALSSLLAGAAERRAVKTNPEWWAVIRRTAQT